MKLRILYHGNCFDGAASAALFSKFYLAEINKNAEIAFTPAMHRAGNAFDRDQFDGDENAVVDFKFCADDRLTWWFDHHESAFLSCEDEEYFRRRNSPTHFLDTASASCCEFIARVAREKYDFVDEDSKELIEWAHTIDGAFYESAAQCVELREPALKLMQIIEGEKDAAFLEKIIVLMREKKLAQIIETPEIAAKLEPILAEHRQMLDFIREKAAYSRGVVAFDLTGRMVDGYNKFIPYYLFPNTTYNVSLTRGAKRTKISVGSNPWSPRPRTANIARICERYGGGGHAVVGAVSLKPDEIETGKKIMQEIIKELQFAED